MKKSKGYLIIIIASIIASASSILAGAISWQIQFLITGLIYFIVGLLYNRFGIRKPIPKLVFSIIILLPFIAIYSSYTIIALKPHGYPMVAFQLVSFFSGIFIPASLKQKRKAIFILTYTILILSLSYWGIPNYTAYIRSMDHKQMNINKATSFMDRNQNTIHLADLKGKVIVFDFWNSACAICFKKFPDLNELYKHYENRDDIEIFAVNLKLKNKTITEVMEFTERFEYDFPFLFTDDKTTKILTKNLKIIGVPTFVILDQDLKVVYSGEMITDKKVLVNNAYFEIEEVLND